jgi:hypothetical protein
VPPSVKVPDVVIGEPLNVRPVVPPDAATDVTVPEPVILSQTILEPFHLSTVSIVVGAEINDVVFGAV